MEHPSRFGLTINRREKRVKAGNEEKRKVTVSMMLSSHSVFAKQVSTRFYQARKIDYQVSGRIEYTVY